MHGIVDEVARVALGSCVARWLDGETANPGDWRLHLPELRFQLGIFFLELSEMCGQLRTGYRPTLAHSAELPRSCASLYG